MKISTDKERCVITLNVHEAMRLCAQISDDAFSNRSGRGSDHFEATIKTSGREEKPCQLIVFVQGKVMTREEWEQTEEHEIWKERVHKETDAAWARLEGGE